MQKPDKYQILITLLVIAILVALGLLVFNLFRAKVGKSAINVNVEYDKAMVLLNGKEAGETPVYKEGVFAKDIDVVINGQNNSYSTKIKPAASTMAYIRRDLGVNDTFNAGQNVWFEKIGGQDAFISVIAPDHNEISVLVDGVEMGKTPIRFSTKDLLAQNEENKYVLKFSKEGFEDQTAEVKAKEGYELIIRLDMFLIPIPADIGVIDGAPEGVVILNLSNVSDPAFEDKKAWASSINYWLSTRGEVNMGSNGNKVSKFNYFVDDQGKVYNETGNEINPEDVTLESGMYVAYLGSQTTIDPTDQAKATFEIITGNEVTSQDGDTSQEGTEGTGKTVKIKPNSYGWLRVRAGPGTSYQELTRVDTGTTYTVIEEQDGWYKIEYEEGKEGWISSDSQYVEIIEE